MNRYAAYEGSDNLALFVEIVDIWTDTVEKYFQFYLPDVKNWIQISSEDFSDLNNIGLYPEPWLWTDIANIYNPVSIQENTLNNLLSLELNYKSDLPLKQDVLQYNTGLQINTYNLFNNFHDISINKGTCFVLTSAITLKDIFEIAPPLNFGQLPGTFKFSPRNTDIYYIAYNSSQELFTLSLTGDVFHISPVPGLREVELLINNQYVQVEKSYPYNVVLKDYSLKDEEVYRQRFICDVIDGIMTIKTLTDSGYRYLTLTSNNILRATGLMLNESIVNDYVFNYSLITLSSLNVDFDLKNHWITYYNDYEVGTENTTVTINKNFTDIPVNYLITFPIEQAIKTGKATVNISSLKTLLTPTGAAAPTDNLYIKNLPTS